VAPIVATDVVDGWCVDGSFQVLNTAYPGRPRSSTSIQGALAGGWRPAGAVLASWGRADPGVDR
jgi:undecaprenyl pyrophosphate phosphatase UppP